MSNSTINFLKHILSEIDYLLKESEDIEFNQFIENETTKRAFSRSLEIIGEAIKNLPDTLRKNYSDIDWKAAAGLRDRLIHGYFNVDYEIIWDVVVQEIPTLKQQIETIIEDIENNS